MLVEVKMRRHRQVYKHACEVNNSFTNIWLYSKNISFAQTNIRTTKHVIERNVKSTDLKS